MINFGKKDLLVTTFMNASSKKGDPVTYVTVLGDNAKTVDLYLKGEHHFEVNRKYSFKMTYNDSPFKYLSVDSYELVK